MAKYRMVYTQFWEDEEFMPLTPEDRYFYLYLLTNPHTTACGIYKLPPRIIEAHTGYNNETVSKLIERFVELGKISYNWENFEIYIHNWARFNKPDYNNNTFKRILKELQDVQTISFVKDYAQKAINLGCPESAFIGVLGSSPQIDEGGSESLQRGFGGTLESCDDTGYGIRDTETVLGSEESDPSTQSEASASSKSPLQEQVEEVTDYLNATCSRRFSAERGQSKYIRARIRDDGATVDECKTVIDNKAAEWLGTDMQKYLRPKTLFSVEHFEDYLDQPSGNGRGDDLEEKKRDFLECYRWYQDLKDTKPDRAEKAYQTAKDLGAELSAKGVDTKALVNSESNG